MTDQMELVVALVAANGGTIVGKTRLQKTVFLLDQCGLSSGFEFEYHNYGPFSADLADAAERAELMGRLKSATRPGYHEVPYVVFNTSDRAPDKIAAFDTPAIQDKLRVLGQSSAIILELAATLRYFKDLGSRDGIESTVRQLKPLKATPERLDKAWKLLANLGLE